MAASPVAAPSSRAGFLPEPESNPGFKAALDDAFVTQFRNPTYNPDGPLGSANCGPASLAMSMNLTDRMPPGLTPEQEVDHARALMTPGHADQFTYTNDANGNSVPLLDRDSWLTGSSTGTTVESGVTAAGGTPTNGSGWEQLDQALQNGPVLASGRTDAEWRANPAFHARVGSGDTLHLNAILGKQADGDYLVADPMHEGGVVEMTKDQLATYFDSGQPSFTATDFGAPAGASPTAPENDGAPPTTAPEGDGPPTATTPGVDGAPSPSASVPSADLAFGGGVRFDPAVEQLQRSLVQAGFMTEEEMATGPGHYGPRAVGAVAELQEKHGIMGNDGVNFGPQTRAALERELAAAQSVSPSGGSPTAETAPASGATPISGAAPAQGVAGLSSSDAETAGRVDALMASRYPNSQMQGQGAALVEACRREGVPLDLALAQLAKESTFLHPANNLSIANNNPGNLRFADWEAEFGGTPGAGSFTRFPSVEDGIDAYVSLLGSDLYAEDVANRDWASLVSKYAPASDGNDEALFTQQLHEWTAMFQEFVGIDETWVNQSAA